MRYYFHLLKDRERLPDHDGQEFASLAAARDEAVQSARDVVADEVRSGRAAPSRWRIQIARQDGTIVDTVFFETLLFGEAEHGPRRPPKVDSNLIAHVTETVACAQTTKAEIRQNLNQLRQGHRELAKLNRSLSEARRN